MDLIITNILLYEGEYIKIAGDLLSLENQAKKLGVTNIIRRNRNSNEFILSAPIYENPQGKIEGPWNFLYIIGNTLYFRTNWLGTISVEEINEKPQAVIFFHVGVAPLLLEYLDYLKSTSALSLKLLEEYCPEKPKSTSQQISLSTNNNSIFNQSPNTKDGSDNNTKSTVKRVRFAVYNTGS